MPPVNDPQPDPVARPPEGAAPARGPAPAAALYRPGGPTGNSATPNLFALLKALRRRWILAVVLGSVLGVVASVAAWFTLPTAKFLAYSQLYVAPAPTRIIFDRGDDRGGGIYQRTQIAMVKSRLVINTALRQPKVADLPMIKAQLEPVDYIEKHIQADYALSQEILRISMTGDDEKEITAIVGAITDAYLQEVVEREGKQRFTRLDKLREIANRYDEQLRSKRANLREMAMAAMGGDEKVLGVQQAYMLEKLNGEERELLGLQSQLRRLRVELSTKESLGKDDTAVSLMLLAGSPQGGFLAALPWAGLVANDEASRQPADPMPSSATPEDFAEDYLRQHPEGAKLLAREAQLNSIIDRTAQVAADPENSPAVARHRANLKATQTQLAALRKRLLPEIEKELRRRDRMTFQANAWQLRQQIAVAAALEKSLSEEIERLRGQTRRMTGQGIDLESLKSEISAAETIAKTIQSETEALRVETEAPARVTRLEESVVVTRTHNEKRQVMGSAGAGLGAFALVLFGISYWEFRARRIGSVDEVVQGLGMRIVGSLPSLSDRSRSRYLSGDSREHRWQSMLAESVDSTRTLLLHAARVNSLRVVMVTSATAGEGKTSLTSQLATSLVRAGRRTVVVDCDLRKPALHRLFDVPAEPGFCEVLRGAAPVGEAVRPTQLDGLSVLPAGNLDAGTLQLLALGEGARVFDLLREQFDFVLIDTSPVLPVTDPMLIAPHADTVVFSLLRNVSRTPQVYAAYQRLIMIGVSVLGGVMNGVRGDSYGAGYYNSYGYGYGVKQR